MSGRAQPRAVFLLVAAAVVLPAAAFLVLHVVTPSDGARLTPGDAAVWQPEGVVLTPIREQPGGLEAGDLLIAVNGESLALRAETLLRLGPSSPPWQYGQTLNYTVIRAGRVQNLPVSLRPFPFGEIVAMAWPTFVVIPIFLVVAWLLYLIRPGEPMTKSMLFASATLTSTAVWTTGLQVSDLFGGWGFWLHMFGTVVAYLWMWASFVHMVLVFPKPQPVVRRFPWLLALVYATPLLIHGLWLAISRWSSPTALAWLGKMNSDTYWVAMLYVTVGGALAIHGYGATRDRISRLQVRWLLFSLMFVSLAALILGFVPELLTGSPIVGWDWISLTSLLVLAALVVAVLRYRLFDIDVIINRTLVYVPLTAFLAGGYAAAIKLFQVFFVAVTGNESDAAVVLTTLILAGAFTPVKNGLQSQVDRRFQEPHSPVRELRAFDHQLQGLIGALDPDESLRRLLELAVEAYGSGGGAVYMGAAAHEVLVHSTPRWSGNEALRVPLEAGGVRVGRLSLDAILPARVRPGVPPEDIQECARRVAHLIYLVGRRRSRWVESAARNPSRGRRRSERRRPSVDGPGGPRREAGDPPQ